MPKIKDILKNYKYQQYLGNKNAEITDFFNFDDDTFRANQIGWCANSKLNDLIKVTAGTVVCTSKALEYERQKDINLLIVEEPRRTFAELVTQYLLEPTHRQGISKTAIIHPTTKIGKNCYIGNYVTIEENCEIGDNCFIDHNTIIHHGTILQNNVKIGCNCTIGGNGFGYVADSSGEYQLFPHLGHVLIEELVEIANNTCVDRGALKPTHIRKGVKIDNLVQIGHNATIGQHTIITSNCMVAGCKLGDHVWLAPSATLMQKIEIGDHALVGMSAVVTKSVAENAVVVGNPARKIRLKTDEKK